MLNALWNSAAARVRTELRHGAGWYSLSSLLAPIVALLLGPLVLRKVGLEEYGVLALAGYFMSLALAYYDFGTYPHLLAAFSKQAPDRHADFGHALLIRAALIVVLYGALGTWALRNPRDDVLYAFLAVSMTGLFFPSPNVDWYLIARKRFFDFFLLRVTFSGVPVVLTLAWFFSPWDDLLWIAGINLIAVGAASAYLVRAVGMANVRAGLACLSLASWRGLRAFAARVLPLALTQFLVPYFLAYALVWYSMSQPDKELVGAFGISYRIAIGFSALLAPMVLYVISRSGGAVRHVALPKILGASAAATGGIGILGVAVIWFYFAISGANPDLLAFTIRNFLILLIGILFVSLRIVPVSRCTSRGDYRTYFLIHACACLPVLFFSWVSKGALPTAWVPLLACVPDVFATLGFIYYSVSRRENTAASLADGGRPPADDATRNQTLR